MAGLGELRQYVGAIDRFSVAGVNNRPTPAANTTYKPLAAGTQGTIQTLSAMAQAVTRGLPPEYSGYTSEENRAAAKALTSGAHTDDERMAALYYFARDQVSYIDHPWWAQVVQDAKRTNAFRSGDCVSKSVLLSTYLAAVNIKSRFVAQASTPEGFDHVYVEALRGREGEMGSGAIALDPTADGRGGRPRGDIGWTQTLADGGFEMAYTIF